VHVEQWLEVEECFLVIAGTDWRLKAGNSQHYQVYWRDSFGSFYLVK
jgi:hypothetical protein